MNILRIFAEFLAAINYFLAAINSALLIFWLPLNMRKLIFWLPKNRFCGSLEVLWKFFSTKNVKKGYFLAAKK